MSDDLQYPLIKSSYRKTTYRWSTKLPDKEEKNPSIICYPNLSKCMGISRVPTISSIRNSLISRRYSNKSTKKVNTRTKYSSEIITLMKRWPNVNAFPLITQRNIATALINFAYMSKGSSNKNEFIKKQKQNVIKLKEIFDKRQRMFYSDSKNRHIRSGLDGPLARRSIVSLYDMNKEVDAATGRVSVGIGD